jgi:micrococcal nuclease
MRRPFRRIGWAPLRVTLLILCLSGLIYSEVDDWHWLAAIDDVPTSRETSDRTPASRGLEVSSKTDGAVRPKRSIRIEPVAAGIRFGLCHSGGGTNCVVDGDTFWLDGAKIRISDIDTPETHPSRCAVEADLGAKATRRLQVLLNQGGLELSGSGRDVDRYGRKLRVVMRRGESIGDVLVSEGLARPYGRGRQSWCD